MRHNFTWRERSADSLWSDMRTKLGTRRATVCAWALLLITGAFAGSCSAAIDDHSESASLVAAEAAASLESASHSDGVLRRPLTERELEVLQTFHNVTRAAVYTADVRRMVSERLSISVGTLKNHRHNIYVALGFDVKDRNKFSRAIQWYRTHQLTESEAASLPQWRFELTDRELSVLALLQKRMSNDEIGRSLVIESGTVKSHVHSILRKLNVTSRANAAQVARNLKLFEKDG